MFYQKKVNNIPIHRCCHYRGYRYGLFSQNIYEDYIYEMHNSCELIKIREKFLQRIIAGIAFDFAKILQINLKKKYFPYNYPWAFRRIKSYELTANNNPDIICHSSKDGILASHINREFFWLECAYESIKKNGYDPEKLGYITVLELEKNKEDLRYIVLDGNHRISSLAVLGYDYIDAIVIKKHHIKRAYANLWPQVIFGYFGLEDALSIFDRYFIEKNMPLVESDDYSTLILDESINFTENFCV